MIMVEYFKEIEMQISCDDNYIPILKFIGGPTGHESFYIDDILQDSSYDQDKELCICAGARNSWPACYVNLKEVLDFIKEHNHKSNTCYVWPIKREGA